MKNKLRPACRAGSITYEPLNFETGDVLPEMEIEWNDKGEFVILEGPRMFNKPRTMRHVTREQAIAEYVLGMFPPALAKSTRRAGRAK